MVNCQHIKRPDFSYYIASMMKEVENQLEIKCEDEDGRVTARELYDALRLIPKDARRRRIVKAFQTKLVQWASHATAKWGTIPDDEGNAVELCAPETAIGCAFFFCDILSLAFPDHKMAPSISVGRPYTTYNPWFAVEAFPTSAQGSDGTDRARNLKGECLMYTIYRELDDLQFDVEHETLDLLIAQLKHEGQLERDWEAPAMGPASGQREPKGKRMRMKKADTESPSTRRVSSRLASRSGVGSDVAVHKRDVERSEGEVSPGQETTVVEEGEGEQEGAPSPCTGTCVAPPVSTCTSVVPSMEPATWDDSVESEALAIDGEESVAIVGVVRTDVTGSCAGHNIEDEHFLMDIDATGIAATGQVEVADIEMDVLDPRLLHFPAHYPFLDGVAIPASALFTMDVDMVRSILLGRLVRDDDLPSDVIMSDADAHEVEDEPELPPLPSDDEEV